MFQFHKYLCKLYLASGGITTVFISWIAPRMIVLVLVPKKTRCFLCIFSFNFLGSRVWGARGSARACKGFMVVDQNLTRPCGGGIAKWAQREMGLAGWEGSCSFMRRRVNYGLESGKRFLKLNSSQIRSTVQIHNISLTDDLSFHFMLSM